MSTFQPARFGPYDLVDRVGEGGMSEVFRAVQTLPGGVERVLALKRIRSVYATDPEFVEMFIDEARVSMLLQHPNVVRVLDFGEVEGAWYLAMEWIDGKDLRAITRRRLERREPWPIAEAVYVASAVLAALDRVHRQTDVDGRALSLVHRDIKPGNILINYVGEVKVLDFGIAKAVSNTHQTDVGTRPGSAAYMSPEQADGRPLDARSDLFSVGVLLYELVAGRPLFRRDSREATLEALRACRVERLSSLRAGVPEALDEALGRALERDPERRFNNARAFRAALEPALAGVVVDDVGEALGATVSALFVEEREAERARFERGRREVRQTREAADVTASLELDEAAPKGPVVVPPLPPPLRPAPPVMVAAPPLEPAPASPPRRRAPPAVAVALVALVVLLWWRWPTADPPPAVGPASAPVAAGGQAVETTSSAPEPSPATPELTPAVATSGASAPASRRSPSPAPAAPSSPLVAPSGPVLSSPGPALPATEEPVVAPEAPPEPEVAVEPEVDPTAPGTVTVRVSAGWAVVYLDGRKIARSTPVMEYSVAPGVHEVRVEQPSTGRVYERSVTVAPGKAASVLFDVD